MHLKDGRPCHFVPWLAQTPAPWRGGYARVFVEYTETERRNARNLDKKGHICIVNIAKLVQDKGVPKKEKRKYKARAKKAVAV